MTPRAGCRASLVALALSFPTKVAAELPDSLRITWRSETECARTPALEEEIERLLGPQAERAAGRFEVEVARAAPSGYALRLRVLDGEREAEREVQLANCREVEEAAALLIATAIDPSATFDPARADLAREQAADRARARAERRKRIARAFSRMSLLLGGFGDLQALPEPTFGPDAGLALVLRGVRLSLSGSYFLPRYKEASIEEVPVRSKVSVLAGSLGLGYSFTFGIFQFGPAVHGEIGYFSADTERTDRARPELVSRRKRPWGNALAGARIGLWPNAAVGLELGLFAGLPLWRFGLEATAGEARRFYRTSPVSARAVLSLRISLGPRSGP